MKIKAEPGSLLRINLSPAAADRKDISDIAIGRPQSNNICIGTKIKRPPPLCSPPPRGGVRGRVMVTKSPWVPNNGKGREFLFGDF